MYKVLLADDEALIRESIRDNMRWEELGFTLCAVCRDGREAIDMIGQTKPDIVLTDICMPYADGLAVARYVFENGLDCKVAIISGYDNFEYAKKAIDYKVSAYVLKPVTAKELGGVLAELAGELDDLKQQKEKQARLQAAFDRNIEMFRERFLSRLIRGSYVHRDVAGRMEQYDVRLAGDYLSVVLIKYMRMADPADFLQYALYNVTEELLAGMNGYQVFQEEGGRTVILVSGASEYEVEQRVYEASRIILEQVRQYFSDPIMMAAGRCVEGSKQIKESYQNAKLALEYEFLFDKSELVYGREFEAKKGAALRAGASPDTADWGGRILRHIKQSDEAELRRSVGEFFDELRARQPKREGAALSIQSLLLYISQSAVDEGVEETSLLEWERGLLEAILSGGGIEQMKKQFTGLCLHMSRELQKEREDLGKSLSRQAMEYIKANYGDPGLSLHAVSKALAISSSYFSALFKAQTGETFVEALTRVRMEHAKELLRTTRLRSYEIAEQVGYSDAHYFGSTFKKYVGMTPKEYVKQQP